jgi:hypothetical protein
MILIETATHPIPAEGAVSEQRSHKEFNMKRLILTSALALAVAAPAFANDQLARSLGLEPGVYTTAELAAIKGVREAASSTDAATAASLEALYTSGVVSTQSVEDTANAQLAASLGLEAGVYTTGELAAIKGVREAATGTDAATATALEALYEGGVVSTQSVGGPATEQLARSLGVNAADYSLAELAALKGDFED